MTPGTGRLDLWAAQLFEGLIAAGIRRVIASPGSRSTPWLLEALRRPELDVLDVVDERSAAFFALGQARASGRPSLLLCTSGTAPAHYLPAVIEAAEAGVPMLVLSADRPLDRLDCGAPQVTDQSNLYSSHVRAMVELGEPVDDPRARRAVAARAVFAVSRSLWPAPGPVHLNARARKPLETESSPELVAERESSRPPRVLPPLPSPHPAAAGELAAALERSSRPILVAGPASLRRALEREPVLSLCEDWRLPLFADAASQLRFVGREVATLMSPALLESAAFRARFRPDLLVQLGAAPLAAGWERWLAAGAGEARHVVITDFVWHDPVRTADLFVFGGCAELCRRLDERLRRSGDGAALRRRCQPWVDSLVEVAKLANGVAAEIALESEAESDSGSESRSESRSRGERKLSEARIARAAVSALPEGGLLALANSLPIRWVDLFGPPSEPELRVWSQRGVNGIDGLVSGVAGTLSVLGAEGVDELSSVTGARRLPPALLLIGDLALLHDLGGLATLGLLSGEQTLVVVVVHNGGGRIFEQLPIASIGLDSGDLAHWTTPQRRSFQGIAATFGLRYRQVRSADGLDGELEAALRDGGVTLLEARVAAGDARRDRNELAARLEARIGRFPPEPVTPKADGAEPAVLDESA